MALCPSSPQHGWGPLLPSSGSGGSSALGFGLAPCFEDAVVRCAVPVLWLAASGLGRVASLKAEKDKPLTRAGTRLYWAKQALLVALVALQGVSVAFTALRSPDPLGDERLYSSILLLLAYVGCLPLTRYEHHRTYSGSTSLLLFYLLQSLLYTLYISPLASSRPLPPLALPITILCLLLVLFVAEYQGPLHPLPAPTSAVDLTPCPVTRANFIERLTYSWMTPLMMKGYRKYLEEEDLWALRTCDRGETLSHDLETQWSKQKARGGKASLSWALLKAYGGPMVTAAALKMVQDCLSYAQPQLLRLLLQFVNSWEEARASDGTDGGPQQREKPDPYRGYLIALCMFVVAVTQTMCLNQYFQRCFEVGMRVRAGLVATIYKKALVLSNDERGARATGDIVNLQSVDVMRLQDLCTYAQILWSGPFQIILAFISLYNLMGWSMLAGVGIIAVFIPLNTLVARYQKKLQQKQMRNKDARTRLMSEILANIRSIKLYAWEYAFGRRLREIREEREVKMLLKIGVVNAASVLLWGSVPVLVSFATFTIYVLTSDKPLTSDVIFPAISLFGLLQFPMAMFASVITSFVEASVAIGRLQSFLLGTELQPDAVKREMIADPHQGDVLVAVKDGEFKWSKAQTEATLVNVDLELKKGELVSVVGRVGSGKSSLAAAVLGEMIKTEGSVTLRGSVAYAPQQPWIMGGTVRENITFGHRYEHAFYQETIEACGLREDLAILPEGDLTAVGERGVSLSGGQKARISLARAVYSRADIFILDDPLSAVDAHVGRHIFDHVIGPRGLLASKARLLITNAIPFVQQSDMILMIRQGVVIERGSFREVMAARSDLYRLLNEFGKMKEQSVSRERAEREDEEEDLETIADEQDEDSDETMADKEARGFNKETFSRRFSRATLRRASVLSTGERKKEIMEVAKNSMSSKEIRATGSVGLKVYVEYIKACSIPGAIGFFVAMSLMQGAQVGQNLWLKAWGEHNLRDGTNGDKGWYLGIFFAFGISFCLLSFVSSVLLWCFCTLRAAVKLHENMFQSLMRSPMSFFETVPVGRILNVASRDVAVVDETLARVFSSAFRTFASVFSTILVLAFSSPPFLLFVLPIAIVYRQVQRYYLASSRELKRLDAVSRSPVFASFQETLGGLPSIRAFRQQKRFIAENEARVDANQQAYFPSFTCNRWLAVRLEFLGSCIILISALLATWSVITGRISAGLVGLMMSYATSVTGSLNWMVRSATEIETNAVSIERLEQYAALEPEAPFELPDKTPEPDWPNEGRIQFEHYSTRYRKDGNLVLKDVVLDVKPGEKIGIVGRTGAGKSTMTLALYRIIEPVEGTIYIDGVDITKIGLYDLRHRLSIIPQDPQLFEGSVRQNLDPEGFYDDSRIWSALESVQLSDFISQMEGKLDARISEGGSNMSIGQRQLVCLARALLKDTKILVMDEATAAVDVESDEHIQRVIRHEFASRTILTIAHRLNTVIDSTRILVMKEGRVAEFAPPQELLQNKDSIFYGLAKQAGIRLDKVETD